MDKTELSAVMAKRASFYDFLARFYEKEVSSAILSRLKDTAWPEDCGDSAMQAGYDLLRGFFAQQADDGLEDELAADYAGTFLAAGQAKGHAAFPYESVYTSKEKLVMQEAWGEVRSIYAASGLTLSTQSADIMEDHISVELKFMAYLAGECGKGAENLPLQRSFLNEHLMNWVEDFCADIETYSRMDFYKAIAKLTCGYLRCDTALLDELCADVKEEAATGYELSHEAMDQVIAEWKKQYRVYAPKIIKGRAGQKETVRFQEISSVAEIAHDRQSDFSAKEVYYPVMQTMFYFSETDCESSKIENEKGILLFLHPCDINALRRTDTIFLKNGDQEDLYYKRLREKVKIVMMECTASHENCFCVSMNSNRAEDYSMAIRFEDKNVKIQLKDKAFYPFFMQARCIDFAPEFVTENAKKAVIPQIEGIEELKLASSLDYWSKFDGNCIGCGGCNTVCPTCSCFDTVDVIYNETSREGERRRVWSSCMLDTFTMTAGGNRARKTAGANMRFKVLHKIYDYKKRFGGVENMCVGCGRCVARCPKDISFFDAINEFGEALANAKKATGGKE